MSRTPSPTGADWGTSGFTGRGQCGPGGQVHTSKMNGGAYGLTSLSFHDTGSRGETGATVATASKEARILCLLLLFSVPIRVWRVIPSGQLFCHERATLD